MIPNPDTQLFFLLNLLAGKSPIVDSIIVFCASYLAYLLVAAFLVFLYVADASWRGRVRIAATAAVATFLSRGLIAEGIRFFFHRDRPFTAFHLDKAHTLITDTASSFPSGHATFFFALSAVVLLYNRRWGTWFLIASTLIVFARVAAGVHYPSDIAAGAIIGVFAGYFANLLITRFWPKDSHQTY